MISDHAQVLAQVMARMKEVVASTARFHYSDSVIPLEDHSIMEVEGECIATEHVMMMFKTKPIFTVSKLWDLIGRIGVADLYSEYGWKPLVCQYLDDHTESCLPLWLGIQHRALTRVS